MNIHFIAGVNVKTPRGHKVSKEGTQPPRERPGIGLGGKYLRRAKSRLATRQEDHGRMSKTDGYNKPGSMKG